MSGDMEIAGVPAAVARHLQSLASSAGVLTVASVLRDAEREDSPLHKFFEWDDTEAAQRYRELQARQVIARVRVQLITPDDTDPVRVRAWISRRDIGVAGESLGPGAYVAIEDVAGETDREASVLRSIRRDIARMRRKYAGFEALLHQELEGGAAALEGGGE